MKKVFVCLFLSVILLCSGCSAGEGSKVETADLDNIDSIYIDHGSTNVHIKSVDQSQLEVSHQKPIIDMKKEKSGIAINVKKRKFHIGPKINLNKQLQVDIPKDYKGKVIINGGSGNIKAEGLETEYIEAISKSGDISLEFESFHSHVQAKTASGNIALSVNKKNPDVHLTTKTASGRQIVTLPLSISRENEKEIEGTLGDGTYDIKIETASGNITVE